MALTRIQLSSALRSKLVIQVLTRLRSRPAVTRAGILETLRAGAAGIFATLVDLGVLAALVSVLHVDARVASIPALLSGGVANFIANRHFAFKAEKGSLARQAALYTLVEVMALGLNGLLYDAALRALPGAAGAYWAVRLVTSHVVFLCWSYPLWRRVFVAPHLDLGREHG